jgi:hypothetical protein
MPIARIQLPDGRIGRFEVPEGTTPDQAVEMAQGQFDSLPPPPTDRTIGQAATDIGAGVLTGLGKVGQIPGQLYGLATGDFKPGVLTQNAKALETAGAYLESPQLKAARADRAAAEKLASHEGVWEEFKTTFQKTISNPALLTNFLAETAPQLLPSFLAARAFSASTMAGKELFTGAAREAALKSAGAAGTRAAIYTGAVQQGADIGAQTYKDISDHLVKEGMSQLEADGVALGYAQATGATAAVISRVAQMLPGASKMEEAFAGIKGTSKGAAGRMLSAAKTATGEVIGEVPEEVGGKFAQNVAMQQVSPETSLKEGLGTAAAMAMIGGGGAGAATGALSPQGAAPIPGAEPVTPEAAPEVAPVTPPPTPPAAPVEPKKAAEAAPGDYYTGSVEDQGLSLKDIQNRDRSGPASIAQMQAIAAKPDYNQVSVSRTLSSGAPVVITDTPIPENRMGKVSNVSAGDGKEIPIQYAVVEAADLTPSHDASGSPSKDFANNDVESIRPVVGNGRVAGLQQAYINDTAADYKANLLRDDDHGIDPVAIYTMDNPILVRVMPKKSLTPDIADVGNKKQALEMSAPEQAKIDMGRFDMQGVDFKADGTPTRESLNGFIMAMPQTEHGNLIESGGIPSKQAVERLNNAMFAKAYDSDALINMHTETADPEAQQVMRALAIAAPAMAQLDNAGEYDIRPDVIKAAEMVVNAKRSGVSLDEYARQRDIGDSENAGRIVQMFADNIRAPKKMGAALTELANTAAAQTDIKEDMFGEKQAPLPLNQVYDVLGKPEVVEPPKKVEKTIPKQEELGTSRIGMGHKEAAKRIPELEAGAKKVAAGEMTKPEYEVLVNKYKKIEPYEDVPVPATPEKAVEILKEPQKAKFGIPSATLKDGDSVGIRLDIPAYTNHGVWISTVHSEGKGVKPGTVIGYEGSTAITNPKFVMSEKGALSIAEGGNKGVLATINGSWNPLSKEEIAAQAKAHLKDPEWAQVGMDPERHSYYYDKTTLEPIVSGSEMLQVGPLILVKNPVYAPKENFLFSLGKSTASNYVMTEDDYGAMAVSPIVKVNALYKLKKARKLKETNKINDTQFEDQISNVISLLEQAKERGRYKGKVRGPNWIRAKLRTGVHNGTISEGEARFVEWLLDQNPNLAHDLAIRITTKEGKGAAGQYSADGRLMTLFASNMNEGTAVHEILHHTERMMPEDVQEGIKKEWAAAWTKAYKNATPEVQAALDDMLLAIAGDTKAKERTMQAFQNGTLDIDTHYQLFGPSEYWAVNGTRILAARNKADTWVKKAWQWLKELVQRIKGLLGLRSDTPILKALSAILKSSGEFVSKNTLTQSEINFSLAEGDPAKSSASWNSPEPTQLDNIIFKYQNKFIDLKRVQEEILESGATIPDRINVYQKETLYHGAVGTKTDEFVNKELGPLMREMKARNVTTDQLETYLHARHAEEANIRIATINPDDKALQDGGSGMSTADAKKYLAGLGKSEKANLEPLAAKVDAILEKTRQLYVDEKLVSAKQVDSWRNMFKHYIPLMREDHDGGMGVGQGISIKGKEVKHRVGAKTKVVNILGNIALQRERVITRAGKNDTAKALAGLVVMNPNPEFWTFDKTPMKRELIKAATFYSVLYHGSVVQTFGTNRTEALRFIAHQGDDAYTLHKEAIPEHVAEVANTNYKQADNVVVTKIEDADGQINEHAIIFNEKNPNAMRLARTLKNLDGVQLEGIMATFAAVTRYFASINTQYNPIFGIINLLRDVQGSLINLSSTALAGKQKEVLSHAIPALIGIYKSVRADRRGEDTTNVMGKKFKEMQLTGGMTGYRDLYKNSDDRSKAIENMVNPQGWQQSKTGKIVTINGRLNVPTAIAQKNLKIIFDWLSDYNLAMEGAIRLSVYQVGLDNGLSKEQSAYTAKNISVNFNRKGDVTTQASALFAFFNASMQGTARIAETLTSMDKGDIKTLKLSKIGKRAIAGGLILGSAQAVLLALAGFDDEDPKEFVREKNLILPIGNKKYVMLPMPLGFNAIPNMGRITTEYALGGFKDPGKYTTKVFSMLADTFNPLGSAGFSLQTVAPTAIDPLAALDSNKDWTGQTIAREEYNKMAPTPGFKRNKDVASGAGIAIAEAINMLTFGTDYTPGKLSPTGDQIDYLAGQVTGGIGREIGKLFTTTKSAVTGEEIPVHRIPLVGRFYGDTGAQSSQANTFYSNLKGIKEVEGEVKGRQKDKLPIKEYLAENPKYKLIDMAGITERSVSELRTHKRAQVAAKKPREEIKKTEEKITKIMTMFNNRVRQAEKDEIRAKK